MGDKSTCGDLRATNSVTGSGQKVTEPICEEMQVNLSYSTCHKKH